MDWGQLRRMGVREIFMMFDDYGGPPQDPASPMPPESGSPDLSCLEDPSFDMEAWREGDRFYIHMVPKGETDGEEGNEGDVSAVSPGSGPG